MEISKHFADRGLFGEFNESEAFVELRLVDRQNHADDFTKL